MSLGLWPFFLHSKGYKQVGYGVFFFYHVVDGREFHDVVIIRHISVPRKGVEFMCIDVDLIVQHSAKEFYFFLLIFILNIFEYKNFHLASCATTHRPNGMSPVLPTCYRLLLLLESKSC